MSDAVQPVAIEVLGVSKIYDRSSPLKTLFGLSRPPEMGNANAVVALRDVSFTISRGESVAIIGRNGSGKSSLLEIIAGTLMPTLGRARSHGRVAALLELGSGFDPGLSGRENVFMNGLLLGLTKHEIRARFDEIVAFADIGDVLDRPVSTYSSGMLVRLAFSVQGALEPDVLSVVEALSVGDFFFQQKCATLIKSLRDRGVTLLFVSHDMSMVRDVCTRALLLVAGKLVYDGDVGEACRQYYASGSADAAVASTTAPSAQRDSRADIASPFILETNHASLHNLSIAETVPNALWSCWPFNAADPANADAVLISAVLLGCDGQASTSFKIGDIATARIAYRLTGSQPVHVVVELTNRMGWLITCIGTYSKQLKIGEGLHGDGRICEVQIQLDVEAGEYSVRMSLALAQVGVNLGSVVDTTPQLGPIRVAWDYAHDVAPHLGLVGLPYSVSLKASAD